jgi:HD-GYP domain-containing protein (c-di-GMP phosphodiesterase class II)
MRYINIEKVESGMVLAKEVFDDDGRVLLAANTILTKEYIIRLSIRGYQGVYIEDELSRGIQIDEVISIELRNEGAKAVKEGNIDSLKSIAKDIVSQLLEKDKSISLDIKDLRTYDNYTYKHSVNVAVISTIIGIYLSYDEESLYELCLAALMHDIGKTKIDPGIINKPGRLSMMEYRIVQEHARYSYDILDENYLISARTKQAVLHHHENEDGTGYPDRLVGDEIPPYAKIIHVADVYDALTSKRPYKKPYALSEAIEYLMGGSNVLFDRKAVEAFLEAVPVYAKGIDVLMTNGERAIVVSNTSNPLRPIVRLVDSGKDIDLSNDKDYISVTIAPHTVVENDFTSVYERFEFD